MSDKSLLIVIGLDFSGPCKIRQNPNVGHKRNKNRINQARELYIDLITMMTIQLLKMKISYSTGQNGKNDHPTNKLFKKLEHNWE